MKNIWGYCAIVVAVACSSGEEEPQNLQLASGKEKAVAAPAAYDINVDENGLALRGFDAIAYYEKGQSLEGKAAHRFAWRGVDWQFASAQNRDKFAADPEKYAPANGGYCTFGIVLSKKFDGDPQVWAIENDRLYIFLNQEVKGKFFQDKEGNFNKVKNNWPAVRGKDASEL